MRDAPLGLPSGSVRALLVILIVVGSMFGLFLVKNESVNNKLFDLLKIIIPLYIGARMPWENKKKENE